VLVCSNPNLAEVLKILEFTASFTVPAGPEQLLAAYRQVTNLQDAK
jgi:hypothetical protein